MSNFFDTPIHPTARKAHRCIACLTATPIGEKYVQQSGFYDGEAFRSRYHTECWDDLSAEGNFEFTPGECERPERLTMLDRPAREVV
jgi:hypothetical protein